MMPGFSDNIQNINDKRKIAGTAAELTCSSKLHDLM